MKANNKRRMGIASAFLFIGALFLANCVQPSSDAGTPGPRSLSQNITEQSGVLSHADPYGDYVYGGNPGGATGAWTTFFFDGNGDQTGTVVIQQETSTTNTSVSAAYTYDDQDSAVTITGYGTYNISVSSLSQGTVSYARLRPNGTPPTLGRPPADLAQTVWAGNGPRSPDWVTLSFRGLDPRTQTGQVVASFVIDNTTNLWTYDYNITVPGKYYIAASTGTDPGAFTVDPVTNVITFDSFFGHAPNWPFNRWE
jgi:hypothetical protein